MDVKICSCWLLLHLLGPVFGQTTNENLTKGRDLLSVEEFHPARYYLKQSLKTSLNPTDRRGAQIALAELFLLSHQPDSATAVLMAIASPAPAAEVLYLQALQHFMENKSNEALVEFNALKENTPTQNHLLLGKINYYAGVIQFRKRSEESIPIAIRDLQNAIRQFKNDSVHTYLKLALARLQLADAYRVNREPLPALSQLRWATKILDAAPYPKPLYQASAYGIQARILFSQKAYHGAKEAFLKTSQLQQASNADSASMAATLINLGLCYDELHDLNNCEKVYDRVFGYSASLKKQPDRYVTFS